MEATTPYMCGLCGKKCMSKDMLSRHMDQHADDLKSPFDADRTKKEANVTRNSFVVGRKETIAKSVADSASEYGIGDACTKLIIKLETDAEIDNLTGTSCVQVPISESEHPSTIDALTISQIPKSHVFDMTQIFSSQVSESMTSFFPVQTPELLPSNKNMELIIESGGSDKLFQGNDENASGSAKLDTSNIHLIKEQIDNSLTENLVISPFDRSGLDDRIIQTAIIDDTITKHLASATQFWYEIGNIRRSVSKKIGKTQTQYHCSLCDKISDSVQDIRHHMTTHSEIRPYQCTVCQRKYKESFTLKQHMKIHLGIKRYSCEICKKRFLRTSHLNSHMITHRQANVECEVCHKMFKSDDARKKHARIHTGDQTVMCPICNKAITQSGYLKIHMSSHAGIRPYKCEICDKSFLRPAHLTAHSRIHANDRAFACHICGKSFNTSSCLYGHMFMHKGGRKKPYKCETCPKAFIRPGALKEHQMRLHGVEKPHNCETCGRDFASLRDLRRHNLTHTGEKPYQCEYCPMRFSQIGSRNTHMLIHTGAKPQKCKICDMKFRHLSSLNNHMRKHAKNAESTGTKDK